MGGIYGCGCKGVYRFHHILSLLLLYLGFFQQDPYFLSIFLNVFGSCSGTFL